MKHVCVLGGSGFVGSAIVGKLSLSGYSVNVLTRRRESSKHLILLPNVTVQECDVMDDVALSDALKQADAVINLIGILHNSKKIVFNRDMSSYQNDWLPFVQNSVLKGCCI